MCAAGRGSEWQPERRGSADYRDPMSSMQPRGPLPARVYWVRRAVVLGVVFLLVFTVTRLFSGGSDEQKNTAGRASGDTSAAGPDQGTEQTTKKPRKKKPKVVLADPDGPCDPAEVTVAPTIEREPAGGPRIEIPLELSTDREACTFVVSRRTVALKITSGSDPIWSSAHCGQVLGTHDVVVRRAKPAVVTIAWNGRRSSEGCVLGNWAWPGGYHAIAASLGGEPVDQYFELTKPKGEVIVKTRKPKKEKKSADQKKSDSKKDKKDKKKGQRQAGPSDDPSTPTEERATGDGAQEP